MTSGYSEWLVILSCWANISLMINVSAIFPANTNPAKRKKPPIPVMLSAVNALLRDALLSLLNPIRKKELMLVNSQKTKSVKMLLAKTTPNIALIKRSR